MTKSARENLGSFGVWRTARGGRVTPELAGHLDSLGFGALWLGSAEGDDLTSIDPLLDASQDLVIATGIVNVWKYDAAATARGYLRLHDAYPGRFLLGIGIGHPEHTDEYRSPYETLVQFTDALLENGVPADGIVLAALGPKVLRLSGEKSAGAHPYLVPASHTAYARSVLGAGPLLAPEHKVVLETDPARAREIGRATVVDPYLGLTNYVSNLKRLGWTEDDVAAPGSDELIDAVVAHGTDDDIADKLREHLDAGADHVALQLLTSDGDDLFDGYRRMAKALGLG
jgi:probable F420-dependent oxidoreductase